MIFQINAHFNALFRIEPRRNKRRLFSFVDELHREFANKRAARRGVNTDGNRMMRTSDIPSGTIHRTEATSFQFLHPTQD